MYLSTAVLFLLVGGTAGFWEFQNRLPNGDQVPHPCKPNFVWKGVGHMNPSGGGARNPFGEDFDKEGKTWSRTLCMKDSDGDGLTNGEELGDPDCVWTAASDKFPSRTTGITHPGVCDPWGSEACAKKNANISCDTGEYICPAIHEKHVKNFTIRFPKTNVPAEVTSYMCMSFEIDFPEEFSPEQEFHIIGSQPIIDNPYVMHHLTVFGCNDQAKKVTEPTLCYMSQEGCFNFIALWTLGMSGECMYKDAGYKIGGAEKLKLMMQFHWTNPEKRTDYYDESGMIIYYTPILRTYNAGMLVTGEQKLEIPPGQARVEYKSTCRSKCTQSIDNSVYIASSLNHMHYLGIEQNLELYRDGNKVRDLANDKMYSYDNPVVHEYDTPQVFLPGDELKTTCVYRSLNRKRTTLFGEGTFEEMCYSLITVFPIENLTMGSCTTWGEVDECSASTGMVGECNRWAFFDRNNAENKALKQKVLDSCNYYGKCRVECPAALAEASKHPCLQGVAREYIMWSLALSKLKEDAQFLSALSSCDCPASNVGQNRRGTVNDDVIFKDNGAEVALGHKLVSVVALVLGLCFNN